MKVETKYEYDESVWFIYENKAKQAKITTVQVTIRKNGIEIDYYVNVGTEDNYKLHIVNGANCYSTREELINSL